MVFAIDVVATAAHREQRLMQAAIESGSSLAIATVTHAELLQQLQAALLPKVRCAPPVVSKLIAGMAAKKVHRREHYVSAPRLVEALALLREYGVDCGVLEKTLQQSDALDDASARRLRALLDAMAESDRRLHAKQLVAAESLHVQLSERLTDVSPEYSLGPLLDVEKPLLRVELTPQLFSWSCATFYLALARHLGARGGAVAIHVLAEPARDRWPASLDRTLRLIEEHEEVHVELTLGLRSPRSAEPALDLQRFVHSLAAGGRSPTALVRFAESAGIEESAHWAVHQVESWLRAGISPEQIALVVRSHDAPQVDALVRALAHSAIAVEAPLSTRGGGSISAAIALAKAIAEGGDVERVTFALSALAGPRSVSAEPVTAIIHAARTMRARSVFAPELQRASKRVSVSTADTAQKLALLLAPLGSSATISQHCARWTTLLDALGVRERLRENLYNSRTDSRALRTAMGREARGVGVVFRTLQTLPTHALEAGFDASSHARQTTEQSITPAEFAAIFEDALASSTSEALRVGQAGVRVIAAPEAVGLSFRAVVVVGVEDGRFPSHAGDEVTLGDGERRALRAQTGAMVARASTKEDETQLFLAMCATATEQLALVGSKNDLSGRVLAASPFIVDARRVLDRVPVWVAKDPLARASLLPPRGQERLCRVYCSNPLVAPPKSIAERVRGARARATIERERSEFFEGIRSEPGRFSGRIEHDPSALEALDLARYATTASPLDVTSLERTARCAFKAFAQQVLKLDAEDIPSLVLDPKERGHLLHALVEAGQKALHDTRNQPHTVRWQRVQSQMDQAAAVFAANFPQADPALLAADTLAIRRSIESWLDNRMTADTRWNMVATEVAFGPDREWSALEIPVDDSVPIVLRGRIDGVERLDGQVRVVEFKSGRGDGFRKRLKDGALDTQFQLVVYAAALYRAAKDGQIDATGVDVDGVYVGFRDNSEHGLREVLGKPTRGGDGAVIDVESLVREGSRGNGALGEAIRRVVLPVRQGVFAPRPRDCEFCNASSLCRVEKSRENTG